MRQQCGTAVRIEFREHVVEQQDRRALGSGGDHFVGRQSQREGEGSLFTLGGVRPRRHPVDREQQFIAMGPDEGNAPTQFVPSGGGEGGSQTFCSPRSLIGHRDLGGSHRQSHVGLLEDGAECRDETLTFGGKGVTGLDEFLVPHREGDLHIARKSPSGGARSGLFQQRIALTQDPVEVGTQCIERRTLRDEHVVEVSTTFSRPTLDQFEVIGGEDGDAQCAEKIPRPGQALTIDLHPSPTGGRDLGLDEELSTLPFSGGPDDRCRRAPTDECVVGCTPERREGGEVTDRFEDVRLAVAVLTEQGRQSRRELEFRRLVRTELGQPQLLEPHRCLTTQTRMGMSR